jgi:HAD superfamily hydrolase (TIGR01509 family)
VVALAVGGLTAADLDAVTLDVYETLVTLIDPVAKLEAALKAHEVERSRAEIATAFNTETAHYSAHSHEGRDEVSLADLNRRCAAVFLAAVGAEVPPEEFAPAYVAALEFEVIPGTRAALQALRRRGLELAVVANWDVSVHRHLHELGLASFFSHVVTAAEAGARKPDPAIFRHALALLDVPAARTLHIGDDPVDEQGAAAAGMRFAHVPFIDVVRRLR